MTILIIVLSACGGSSHNTTSASPTVGSSGHASVIRLGEINSLTGAVASTAEGVADGVTAWVDYTNAHGGINGHPVKVFRLDDNQGSAAVGLQDAQTLVQQDHVVAFVGEAAGSVENWQSYVQNQGVPVVGGQSSEVPFLVSPDFFGSGTNVLAIVYGQLKLAQKFGHKVGNTYCAELAVCAQSVTLSKALASPLGVTVSPALAVSSAAPGYAAQCETLKQAGVDSYTLGLASATALRVAKDCKALGFRSPVVISDGTLTADWLTQPNLAGTAVVGSDVSYTDDSTPAEQQFHAAIKQYQPNIGSLLGPNVVEGWVSGQLLAKAVEASGASTVTSSSIKEGLYKLKGETLGGMTPPLTYSRGKASPINCFFPETISQGQLGTPNGSTTECAPSGLVAAISAKL